MAVPDGITPELLYRAGMDVFGDFADYKQWLNSEIPNLGRREPSSLVHTEAGRKEYDSLLNAIMHSIYL